MDIQEYQRFISAFYKKRNWYQYDPFIRSNFLTEEVGEVCRAIRTIVKKSKIVDFKIEESFNETVKNVNSNVKRSTK